MERKTTSRFFLDTGNYYSAKGRSFSQFVLSTVPQGVALGWKNGCPFGAIK
jgi:hypothetical protein